MNKQRLVKAIMAALVLGSVYGSSAFAATIVAPGTSESSVNKSITVGEGTEVKDLGTVNGSIRVGDNAAADDVETVNGAIRFGDNARADSVETVNGRIEAGNGFVASGNLETVNGSIRLGKGASVMGNVETVNGGIELVQSEVRRDVKMVNGSMEVRGSHVGGNLQTTTGGIELTDGSVVDGDILIKKPRGNWGWSWGKKKGPTVVIGANVEVKGRIIVENEDTKLFIDPSAKVGGVEGIQAQTLAER